MKKKTIALMIITIYFFSVNISVSAIERDRIIKEDYNRETLDLSTFKSKESYKYVYGIEELTLREKASSSSRMLGKIYLSDKVKVIGYSGDFAKIEYNDKNYYVVNKYLTEKKIEIKEKYVFNIEELTLREKASSSSRMLGKIYLSDKVKVIGHLGDFAKIEYNNKNYYVVNRYLTERKPETEELYVSNIDRLSLRERASSSSKLLGYIYIGEKVKVTGHWNDFDRIEYKDKSYYIISKYLSKETMSKYKYVVGINELTLREKASSSSSIITMIPEGERVTLIGGIGDFAKVKYKDKIGYVVYEKFLSQYTYKLVSNIDKLSLREKPDANSKYLGSIENGTKVRIYGYTNEWAKIEYNSNYVYVLSDYLKNIKYVEGIERLTVRQSASYSANVLGYIARGSRVEVIGYENDFAKIKYNNDYAYVVYNKLSYDKVITDYIEVDSNYISTVNTRYTIDKKVKLLKNPFVCDDIVGFLTEGSKIELVDKVNGKYSKIKYNGENYGYVYNECISHRNPFAVNSENIVNNYIGITHEKYVESQKDKPYTDIEEVYYYSNPLNLPIKDNRLKYQFLKLDRYNNVNLYDLNEYLNSLSAKNGNVNIFKDTAKYFVDAARKYNIDPIYLVAHAMLETGYGQSRLAQGITITKDLLGNTIPPTKVYNFFGIGAIDSNVLDGGTGTAYALGWTTPKKAIEGAAQWISYGIDENNDLGLKKSLGYIHSNKYTHQYTLYSMRFDYIYTWHQYATDPQWATKISKLMNKISYAYEGAKLEFENIIYK